MSWKGCAFAECLLEASMSYSVLSGVERGKRDFHLHCRTRLLKDWLEPTSSISSTTLSQWVPIIR